ncbi:MAG: NADH-quinone oxidoreductase subunit NuoG [Betaproteobacteria bacterium]
MAQLNIEIDGTTVQVPQGATVMDAANQLGVYIPHFCYHKKLSIAANCRMCLVQVEKAPKPLPACATPVTDGMKVQTHSEQAVTAQKGVMEFLLINHPLDCPICDQGGECQLQDLAVGYGASNSRYTEDKRIVFHKYAGPLISMEEMTRCIHCTRCVRFGQEIAGVMELGMSGRGEHAEIQSFVGRTVDSELSGNMIDLCPVGALTSKPFRYKARTWELARRKSVSPHDSLGSNLVVQVKGERVLRVLPLENEDLNECWLSDKDRFSYEGLDTSDRLTRPMLKQGGAWVETDWQTALQYVAHGLDEIKTAQGGDAIAALVSPHSTLEEMALAARLVRGLDSDNIDFRLRQNDFRVDGKRHGAPWLGMRVADINALDRILVVGSFLRKDQPLLSARIRHAVKKGAGLNVVHATDDNLLMPVVGKAIVAPDRMAETLAAILAALAAAKGAAPAGATPDTGVQRIAGSLAQGKAVGVFLGNFAVQHPDYAGLAALARQIAAATGGRFGILGEAANSVGGYLAEAAPQRGGGNARTLFETPRQAYVLLNVEPEFDCADPITARAALDKAAMVVALTSWKHAAVDYADVMLPVSPFTETSGSFVNCDGTVQSFNGVVRPLGETRPAWKVLRVLGNLLGVAGFEYDSSEAVRDAVLAGGEVAARLSNEVGELAGAAPAPALSGLQRIAEVPIYSADPLVRRAPSLQQTADARPPRATMNGATAATLGLSAGSTVRITGTGGTVTLPLAVDDCLPNGCVRVPAARPETAVLGAMTGNVTVETG